MRPPPTAVSRFPWRIVLVVIVAAVVGAWTLGFMAGVIVRLLFGR